jgi:hypothetical protein
VKKKLSHIIKPDRTIGLLLDVKEVQLMDIHRESEFEILKIFLTDLTVSLISISASIIQQMAKVCRSRPRPVVCQWTSWNRARHLRQSFETATNGK